MDQRGNARWQEPGCGAPLIHIPCCTSIGSNSCPQVLRPASPQPPRSARMPASQPCHQRHPQPHQAVAATELATGRHPRAFLQPPRLKAIPSGATPSGPHAAILSSLLPSATVATSYPASSYVVQASPWPQPSLNLASPPPNASTFACGANAAVAPAPVPTRLNRLTRTGLHNCYGSSTAPEQPWKSKTPLPCCPLHLPPRKTDCQGLCPPPVPNRTAHHQNRANRPAQTGGNRPLHLHTAHKPHTVGHHPHLGHSLPQGFIHYTHMLLAPPHTRAALTVGHPHTPPPRHPPSGAPELTPKCPSSRLTHSSLTLITHKLTVTHLLICLSLVPPKR